MHTDEFVDATVFLGMNSTDEKVRRACTSFFAERMDRQIAMTLDQVGRCDDIVWGYPRDTQDLYYPFMDNLHTELRFDRLPYGDQDVLTASRDRTAGLDAADRLMLAMVANHHGTLYTLNSRLLSVPDAPVRPPCAPESGRVPFPGRLESLYQASLALLVDPARL